MGNTREALIAAARDHDAACYRDLPNGNPARRRADVAVREVLEAVARALGLQDGTRITLRKGDSVLVEEGEP